MASTRENPNDKYDGQDLVCPNCGNTLSYDGTSDVPICEGSFDKPHVATLAITQEAANDTNADTNANTFQDTPSQAAPSADNPTPAPQTENVSEQAQNRSASETGSVTSDTTTEGV
jgi:hypothetical protein